MPAFQNILYVLGWSLMDSIWQMGLMWLAYTLLTLEDKRISAAGKHNLIVLFVFISSEWFVCTFLQLFNEPSKTIFPGFILMPSFMSRWIPWLSSGYLLILCFRLLQYASQFYLRNRNKKSKFVSSQWQSVADRYARLLGIRRRVQVYLCGLAETAETSQFFKPLILIPISLVTRLSPVQLEAIVVHELFHIRRNDYLINICISCFRGIFFFNPFAQFFYKALTKEREMACDEGVLQLGFAPELYAETLFSLEKFRHPPSGFSLAIDGNKPWQLMERICRVLGKTENKKKEVRSFFILSGLLAITLVIFQTKRIVPRELSVVKKSSGILTKESAMMPVRSETNATKKNAKGKKNSICANEMTKPFKKRMNPQKQSTSVIELFEEPDPSSEAYFAENNIVRDYSNQPSADLSRDALVLAPGAPYVPSSSFFYDARPVILAGNGFREAEWNQVRKKILQLSNLKKIAGLRELEIQLEKNSLEIKRIELRNKERRLPVQGNSKLLLIKIQKQIFSRMKELNLIRTHLAVSEEEIIHI